MPRLPSEFDLGGLPNGVSGRPIASYDGAAVGEGIATLGKGLADAGSSLNEYAEKQKVKDNTLQITSAQAGLNANLIDSDAKYQSDKDPDYGTWAARHKEEVGKALEAQAAQISDPYRRKLFIAKNQDDIAKNNARIAARAEGLINGAQRTQAAADIDQFTNQAFAPGVDETQRQQFLTQREAAIDASIKAGIFTQAEGITLKKNTEQRTSKLLLQSLSPEQRLQALSPIKVDDNANAAIGFFKSKGWTSEQAAGIAGGLFVESKFNPNARNPGDGSDGSDSEGLGQWNAERAKALKAFAAAKGKPSNDFQTQLEFVQHELETSEAPAAAKLRAATDVESATNAFLHYERPKGYQGGIATASNGLNRLRAAKSYHGSDIGATPASDTQYAAAAAKISPEDRASMEDSTLRQIKAQQAQTAAAQTEVYNQNLNSLQTGLHDGNLGASDIVAARKAGWLTDIGDIQKAEAVLAKKEKDTADITGFYQALSTPGFAWNPMDKSHKDMVDAGFTASGGDINSLQNVVEKTHIVPSAAAIALRGSIASSDPQRAQAALTVASNLQRYNPNVFAGVEGGATLANQAVAYNHYVNDLGLDAKTAAQKVIQEASPEYEASTKAKVKSLNVDQVVKDNLKPTDLASAFNNGLPFFGRPDLGAPNAQIAAMGDYEELFRDNYLRTGDVGVSKAQAIAQMKMIWGVSKVTGSSVLTRYPPDMAPAFAGVENAPQAIADQAAATIKATAGTDVPRDKLIITPNRETAFPYKNGQPPPFSLSWIDKNGHVQVAKDMFIPDPNEARRTQTERRQTDFETARAARNAPAREGMDLNTQTRPMFGNPDTVAPTTDFPDRIGGGL